MITLSKLIHRRKKVPNTTSHLHLTHQRRVQHSSQIHISEAQHAQRRPPAIFVADVSSTTKAFVVVRTLVGAIWNHRFALPHMSDIWERFSVRRDSLVSRNIIKIQFVVDNYILPALIASLTLHYSLRFSGFVYAGIPTISGVARLAFHLHIAGIHKRKNLQERNTNECS